MKEGRTMIKLPHDHGGNTKKIMATKPDEEKFLEMADMFSLISDATRLKILWLLCHSEECVINIAAAVEMSSPAASHHLRVLKQSGIIKSRREGKETYYTLADNEDARMVHKLVDNAFGVEHE